MGNVTAKASGEIASFMTPAETNITSLKVHFSPKQLGTGDPSPENVREIEGWDGVEVNGCGKNLVPFLKKVLTATNNYNGYSSWSDPWKILNRTKQYTYSVYIDNTNGTEPAYCKIWFKNEDNTTFVDGVASLSEQVPVGSCKRVYKTIIAKENTYYFGFGLQMNVGCVASNPIVYESDQRITIPIDFTNNYLNKVQITNNKTINSTGEEITESGMSVTDYIPVNENEEWLLRFVSTTAGRTRRIWGYDENKQPISEFAKVSWATVDQEYTLTATITNDVKYIRACYYTNDTDLLLTIDGTSFKNVYGGYVDLITGEIKQEWSFWYLDSSFKSNFIYSSSYNGWWLNLKNALGSDYYACIDGVPSDGIISNKFKGGEKRGNYINSEEYIIKTWGGKTGEDRTQICLSSTLLPTTIEEFGAWLDENKPVICFKLLNPFVHQLDSQELKSFIGQNNFWSNADYVEIEYELKETEDIQKARKKIILNQPHIITKTGSTSSDYVTHFNTDMKAPLKECKVYFEPIQEGEGNPSPDNVRNITGWNEVETYKSGKNIAHIVGYSANVPASSDPSLRKISNNYGTTINTTDFSLPDTKIIVTQSSYTTDYDPVSYRNGYFAIIVDNLDFTKRYNVSFNVDDIINNPLNVDLSRIRAISPAGTGFEPPAKIDGNRLFFKNVPFTPHSNYPNRKSFEIRNAGMSFTLSEFMVTPVDDEDFEYEPYQGTIDTTNWTSDIGTVYGGYVDLISGELVENYKYIRLDANTQCTEFRILDNGLYTIWYYINDMASGSIQTFYNDSNIMCNNIQKVLSKDSIPTTQLGILFGNNKNNVYLYNMNHVYEYTTKEEISAWLNENPVYVTVPLATPITHQLTPQQLLTLKGTNNIWSNSNGQTEVKFWTH